ncbi:MAG: hypothetical protein R3B06_12740 [Kofleriaceae bacterium]
MSKLSTVVSRGLAALLGSVLATGCVLSPVWGDAPSSRRDPIDLTGMAGHPNAPLRLEARSYTTGAYELVRTFSGTSTQWAASPNLYGWSTNSVQLADRFWSPGGCESSGMASLRVVETNPDGTETTLSTFDAAGKDCLNAHLAAGEHPVTAGAACDRTDPTIVLFTPVQCVVPTSVDASPAVVTVRLTDPTRVWQATSGGADVAPSGVTRTSVLTATGMTRDRDSSAAQVRLVADLNVQCRRASDGLIVLTPRGWNELRTQTAPPGARAQISLDASRAISIPSLVASCQAGTSFVRLDADLFAVGANPAGAMVSSPHLRFTVL